MDKFTTNTAMLRQQEVSDKYKSHTPVNYVQPTLIDAAEHNVLTALNDLEYYLDNVCTNLDTLRQKLHPVTKAENLEDRVMKGCSTNYSRSHLHERIETQTMRIITISNELRDLTTSVDL